MMDLVAQCLSAVREQLDKANGKYTVSMTRPTRNLSGVDENYLYVIRQQVDANGVYHLIVAAKMA